MTTKQKTNKNNNNNNFLKIFFKKNLFLDSEIHTKPEGFLSANRG